MPNRQSTWIDLRTQSDKVLIQEHHQTYAAIHELPFPDAQDPQMLMLIGAEAKTSSMKRLDFLTESRENHNGVHLSLIPGTITLKSPMFISDCELHNLPKLKQALAGPMAGNIEQRLLSWHARIPQGLDIRTVANILYAKLVAPFSTVICFFAEDLGGTIGVAKMLSSWIISLSNRSSEFTMRTFPRVIVLKEWNDMQSGIFDEKLATREFLRALMEESELRKALRKGDFGNLLKHQFGDLRVLAYPAHPYGITKLDLESVRFHLNRLDQSWTSLRKRLLQDSQDVQERRRKAQIAFSANHFKAFFHAALHHFSSDIVTPFSFVQASRLSNPVPLEFPIHISRFLREVPYNLILSVAAPTIASALSLDSYPPEMHLFEASHVFETLYSKIVDNISAFPKDKQLRSQLSDKVRAVFCQQNTSDIRNSVESSIGHRLFISQFRAIWAKMLIHDTCLTCLARRPENFLSCGHSLCDPCTIIHGSASCSEPWNISLRTCPLCNVPNIFNFVLKPYTAGIRGLTLNGGSSREALILQALETELQLPMPIREHFDIANGAGNGGALLILAMFCKEDWGIEDSFPFLQRLGRAELSEDLPQNSLENRETHLKKSIFSPQWSKRLSVSSYTTSKTIRALKEIFGRQTTLSRSSRNTKIAITRTNKDLKNFYVHSNFNGPEERPEYFDHIMIRPNRTNEETCLWQLASAIEDNISDVHRLTTVTVREQSCVWSRSEKDPDVFLFLGGSSGVLSASPPWLQDHRRHLNSQDIIRQSADRLLASLFYIELVGVPLYRDNVFVCKALIRCRLLPSQPALEALVRRLHKCRANFYFDMQRISCVDDQLFGEVIRNNEAFSRQITFSVLSMQHSIDIKVDGITRRGRSISNCPYVLHTLIEDQGLHCIFGHMDHNRRYRGVSS